MRILPRSLVAVALFVSLTAPVFAITEVALPALYAQFAPAPDRLFIVYLGGDNSLNVGVSYDGKEFARNAVTSVGEIRSTVGAAYFKGRLWIAYDTLPNHVPNVISSADGVTFTAPRSLGQWDGCGNTMLATPTKLFVAWCRRDSSKLRIAQTTDGETWTTYDSEHTLYFTPSMAWANDRLYVTWRHNDVVKVMSSSDGLSGWTATTWYDGSKGTPDTGPNSGYGGVDVHPRLAVIGGVVHLVWGENGLIRIQRDFGETRTYLGGASYPQVFEFNGQGYLFMHVGRSWYLAALSELNEIPE